MAKKYKNLSEKAQINRLEKIAGTLGVRAEKDHPPWHPQSDYMQSKRPDNLGPADYNVGKDTRSYKDRLESVVQRGMNDDYSYRTAMQYTPGLPVHVNKPQEALDAYRVMRQAHKARGKNFDEDLSQADVASAAQHIFENYSAPNSKKKNKKQDSKLAAPTETILSRPAAEANAFVEAHNAMTIGNTTPLSGIAASNEAGVSSPEAGEFKKGFQSQLMLGNGADTSLTFTEGVTSTKPTVATEFIDKYKDAIKKNLQPM